MKKGIIIDILNTQETKEKDKYLQFMTHKRFLDGGSRKCDVVKNAPLRDTSISRRYVATALT
ncbi:hypothetical protein DWZ83_03420 [Amedibacillus dolichus]|uniref:Uncharacterized protein n=1 Tax=Amedibacillus dolichus TaxID=31971 RepID=A0A415PMW8_9FIRM|nr:hypothetical protein DWZ83_03420 [Amedibacillus dolichus]